MYVSVRTGRNWEIEGERKNDKINVVKCSKCNIWRIWVNSIRNFFALFLLLFCRFKITSEWILIQEIILWNSLLQLNFQPKSLHRDKVVPRTRGWAQSYIGWPLVSLLVLSWESYVPGNPTVALLLCVTIFAAGSGWYIWALYANQEKEIPPFLLPCEAGSSLATQLGD